MTEPSKGQQRCMIYRPARRVLPTGCLRCGLSLIACQAHRENESVPCCDVCDHD